MTLNDSVFSTIVSFMMVILTHTSFSHFSNDKAAEAREVKSVCVSEDTSEYDRIECSKVKCSEGDIQYIMLFHTLFWNECGSFSTALTLQVLYILLLVPAVSSMVEMLTEKGILMGQLTLGDSTRAHTSIVPTLSVPWYMDLSSLTTASVWKKHNGIIDACMYTILLTYVPSSSQIDTVEFSVLTLILVSSLAAASEIVNISTEGSTV